MKIPKVILIEPYNRGRGDFVKSSERIVKQDRAGVKLKRIEKAERPEIRAFR